MPGYSVKLLKMLDGLYRPAIGELEELARIAMMNKLYLPFLREARDLFSSKLALEEKRFRMYISNCLDVAGALSGLRYAFYKFRRPVDHVSVDLDVLIHVDDVPKAVRRLVRKGFRLAVPEPYTVTLERGGFIVDLYTHPAFAWIVYMDGLKVLRDYSEEFELAGVRVAGITREAEIAVAAAHAVYKEHIILLMDCLTAWRWLNKRALRVAEDLGAERALEVLLDTCSKIEEGLAEAPYKLTLSTLLKAYIEKAMSDRVFRATSLNLLKYAVKRRGFGRALLERLTRKSY